MTEIILGAFLMIPWFTSLPFIHLLDFENKEVNYAIRFEKESRYYVIRLQNNVGSFAK